MLDYKLRKLKQIGLIESLTACLAESVIGLTVRGTL